MALTTCKECSKEISTTAKACPHCGAKVPRTKWWLWVPLGLVALFFGYGLTIPEYQGRATRARELCEKMPPGGARYECDKVYDNIMAEGRRAAGK